MIRIRLTLRTAFLLTALIAFLAAFRLFVGHRTEIEFMSGGYGYPVRTTPAEAERELCKAGFVCIDAESRKEADSLLIVFTKRDPVYGGAVQVKVRFHQSAAYVSYTGQWSGFRSLVDSFAKDSSRRVAEDLRARYVPVVWNAIHGTQDK